MEDQSHARGLPFCIFNFALLLGSFTLGLVVLSGDAFVLPLLAGSAAASAVAAAVKSDLCRRRCAGAVREHKAGCAEREDEG